MTTEFELPDGTIYEAEFYCPDCFDKGVKVELEPIADDEGHLDPYLYCPNCKQEVSHYDDRLTEDDPTYRIN